MTTSNGINHVVRLEGDLTIYTARDVADSMLAALRDGGDVEVDLSAVAEVDSAGLQVMIAAKRMAAEQGIGLRLVGHSPTVVDILDLTDLVNHFGDPLIIQKGAQA